MNFSDFLMLRHEGGLIAIFLVLLVYDIFASEGARRSFHPVACVLFAIYTAYGFLPCPAGEAFGGMYIASDMTSLMKNILNVATLLVLLQAGKWLRTSEVSIRQGEFYTIIAATLLGMQIMISSGNFMMLYIGIEAASLPLACLTAYNKRRQKSAEAGAKYILMAALSSGVMLFGLSYLYASTGTMYFSDMAAGVASATPIVIMGLVFFLAGLAFKISLVPFHLWTADVYEGAPTPVTAFLSVVSKGAACFVLIFSLYKVFGGVAEVWHHILWALSVITIVIGNLFAIRQKDIKRFFAFSSISQAGYILLGVLNGTAQGMTAVVYFVLVYVFSNMAAFGVITAVENQSGRTDIAGFNGLRRTNPRLAFVMMLAVFSLAGIPPFAGFFSKFFIFAAAAANGEYLLVFIALVNTVISLYYYLLIIKAMFISEGDASAVGSFRTDGGNRLSLVICTAGIIVIGLLSCIYTYIGGFSFSLTL